MVPGPAVAAFGWRPFAFGLAGYAMFGVGYIGYMTFVVALLRSQGTSAAAVTLFYALLGVAVCASSRIWALRSPSTSPCAAEVTTMSLAFVASEIDPEVADGMDDDGQCERGDVGVEEAVAAQVARECLVGWYGDNLPGIDIQRDTLEDLDRAVPACPGWSVADLIEHLEAVLAQMLKLETINEALQQLRDIIKSQEELQEKTRLERKKKLIEGLQ